jgi:hypothetical protein
MNTVDYASLDFKIPKESADYRECSDFLIRSISEIIQDARDGGRNKIQINTNLKYGIPMENVNKIAGPFVEAWAYETFLEVLEDADNKYLLINVEAGERLNMADVILQFKRERKNESSVTGFIDVKATSQDIKNSGKSPNITSFARIRSMYIQDPDYIFIVLSIKHKVFSQRDNESKLMMGIMEIVDHNVYDLKYLSSRDISYNPALGTGQIQIRDIHYVSLNHRNVWEFCQLLDVKCINSKKGFEGWYDYAKQNEWLRE